MTIRAIRTLTIGLGLLAAAPLYAQAAGHYTTAETDIGTLLDDPAAKAIVFKHLPKLAADDQVNMARSLTLRGVQSYAPDDFTDEKLKAIDAELAALPAKPAK